MTRAVATQQLHSSSTFVPQRVNDSPFDPGYLHEAAQTTEIERKEKYVLLCSGRAPPGGYRSISVGSIVYDMLLFSPQKQRPETTSGWKRALGLHAPISGHTTIAHSPHQPISGSPPNSSQLIGCVEGRRIQPQDFSYIHKICLVPNPMP